jgi:hypothetical protein
MPSSADWNELPVVVLPAQGPSTQTSGAIQITELVALASEILSQQQGLATSFQTLEREEALQTILRVGTSTGGTTRFQPWVAEINKLVQQCHFKVAEVVHVACCH